jgi:hypothetical protein
MEAGNGQPQADQSVTELVKQLADQTSTLVRQEMELAKAELRQKGKLAGIGAGAFGGAGLLGLFALGALTAAAILGLATAIDGWLAALVVAAVYGAVAGVLALVGRNKVQEASPPIPEQATESVKEDVEWTKTRAAQGRR